MGCSHLLNNSVCGLVVLYCLVTDNQEYKNQVHIPFHMIKGYRKYMYQAEMKGYLGEKCPGHGRCGLYRCGAYEKTGVPKIHLTSLNDY